MATETILSTQSASLSAEIETQIKIQFTTGLSELSLPDDSSPVLVPTSEVFGSKYTISLG